MLLTSRIFTIIFYDSNGRSSLVLLVKELEDRLEAGVRSPRVLRMTCNATKEIGAANKTQTSRCNTVFLHHTKLFECQDNFRHNLQSGAQITVC